MAGLVPALLSLTLEEPQRAPLNDEVCNEQGPRVSAEDDAYEMAAHGGLLGSNAEPNESGIGKEHRKRPAHPSRQISTRAADLEPLEAGRCTRRRALQA